MKSRPEQPPEHGSPIAALGIAAMTSRREQLRSEILRGLLMLSLLALCLATIVLLHVFPGLLSIPLDAEYASAFEPGVALASIYMAYEFGAVWRLKYLYGTGASLGFGLRAANVVIEVSFPTALLVAGIYSGDAPWMLSSNIPLIYFLLISLTAMSLESGLCIIAGVTAAVGYAAVTLLASAVVTDPRVSLSLNWIIVTSPHYVVVRGIMYMVAGFTAGFVAVLIQRQMNRALAAADEHNQAIGIFGRHVSPQVVKLLVEKRGVLEGEERDVCIMFLDIRDFSRFASAHTPVDVLAYVNTLFKSALPVVIDKGGIVNKLLGDGFMAVFGAPLHDEECCIHAVEAAQEILRRVDEMNRSDSHTPTRIGIGLHYGRVIAGNVGGEDRMEYTVVGDVVNVAARVEQATKSLNARLLLSDAVLAASPAVARLRPQEIGPVELKGQDQPFRLYKLG